MRSFREGTAESTPAQPGARANSSGKARDEPSQFSSRAAVGHVSCDGRPSLDLLTGQQRTALDWHPAFTLPNSTPARA
ncbi:MAG: hypothetical protein ACK5HA_16705 [Planctomycetaceae bacterium]